jgi:hypothetical protein
MLHGPFHRLRNATTQSDAVALLQQQSQEIWGLAARWSNLRSVKAYVGSLPINAEEIEFMTPWLHHTAARTMCSGTRARKECYSILKGML